MRDSRRLRGDVNAILNAFLEFGEPNFRIREFELGLSRDFLGFSEHLRIFLALFRRHSLQRFIGQDVDDT